MKNKAFTLIEMLIVVGIIAAIAIAVFIMYPKIKGQQRAGVTLREIETVVTGVRTNYGMSNYRGLSTASVINSKIFPERMVEGGVVTNDFGGRVLVEPAMLGGGSVNSFKLTWEMVPDYECFYILKDAKSLYAQISVNDEAQFAKKYPSSVDPDIDKALEYCKNGSNTLYFWIV